MRLRRLQFIEDGQWYEDAYAYEDEAGNTVFRYSTLTWGRVGARYNKKVKEAGVSLENVHTVIPCGDKMRWLDVEIIEEDVEAYLEALDEACYIPKPRKVSLAKAVAA